MKNYKLSSIYKTFFKIVTYSWKATPATFIMLIIGSAAYGLLQVGQIYGMQRLFDLAAQIAEGSILIGEINSGIILVSIVFLAGPLLEAWQYLAQGHFWRRVNCYFHSMVHIKTARLDLIDFERTDVYDNIQKAVNGTDETPVTSRGAIELIFMYIPFFVFTSTYLFSIKPLLVLALVLVFLPVFIAEILKSKNVFKLEDSKAPIEREMKHYDECITSSGYFKETRSFGAFSYFYNLFKSSVGKYNKLVMVFEKKNARNNLWLSSIKIAGYVGILTLLVYFIVKGEISLGVFAAVFYSIEKMNSFTEKLVENIGEMLGSISAGIHLFEFLDKENEKEGKEVSILSGNIILSAASFIYPGSEHKAVDKINFSIKEGETIAIVGANGAGKTTLTRLIVGLYKPSSGHVYRGDICLDTVDGNSAYADVSAVFQSFVKYKMTLGENINISDIESEKEFDDAVTRSGLVVVDEEFPDGFDTMLSREFKGKDLSGGQWQRIAITRGFYRDSNIIVLDEPTAAIDPIEEIRIFETFMEAAKGKTAVLVTHRLGSAKIADRIIVMEKGSIVEVGTHNELLASGGLYSVMYREQSKWYKRT